MNERLDSEARSFLCSWLLTNGPTLFCFCKLFECKVYSEMSRRRCRREEVQVVEAEACRTYV